MEKFTAEETLLLRQMVDEYLKTLESLPEDTLDENKEQLKLCLSLQRKFDNGADISEPAWSNWEE